MNLTELNAISPVDGRYRGKTSTLAPYFSEASLIKYRVMVEIEYFIALCAIPLKQLKHLNTSEIKKFRSIYRDFSEADAMAVKEIERVTNHDVKAVEYFIRQKFEELGYEEFNEFIHFGLTSQDINNTAVPLSLKDAWKDVIEPALNELYRKLTGLKEEWKEIPMLARTHGQPASPTLVGKEIYVFAERIEQQLQLVRTIPFSAKFGGATGNFNAHYAAYPDIDWVEFANVFVDRHLGLTRLSTTTQIEHYDNFAAFCDNMKRISTILIDLDRDMWTYISMEYFKQKIKKGEVGSSTMPHKVNPIDFENSEGNLGIGIAIFEHLAAKLPISRLQRDLTDSTVTRNIGTPLAHMLIGIKSLLKGLNKVILNEAKIKEDLDNNWAVVAEAIQTILRREKIPNPYEMLKELTRTGETINKKTIARFIDNLDLPEEIKTEMRRVTPENYTGKFDL